ncbi:MAG: hypothetical protein MZV70_25020 [Desulfobacterales bacterium]|nr:hypothetical protein [Desulfobacterales bacterium]
MRRAMIDGTETGMAKILCDSRGRIVGAHILGEGAGEVIHELQLLRALRQAAPSLAKHHPRLSDLRPGHCGTGRPTGLPRPDEE